MRPNLNRITRLVVAFVTMSAVALGLSWSSLRADDDDEVAIRHEEARRSFVENCLMCHGEDMTSGQRLTTKQWTAEVEKMVGWGSPLPADRKQPLAQYLSELYPSTKPKPALERVSAEKALATQIQPPLRSLPGTSAERGKALYATHCSTCHGPEGKGAEQGINVAAKPVLLEPERFRGVVKSGLRKMPAFSAVLDEAATNDILTWMRTLR